MGVFFSSLQVRIPTSYDKPGTSQLVQSAQVNTQGVRKEVVVEMWDTFALEQGHQWRCNFIPYWIFKVQNTLKNVIFSWKSLCLFQSDSQVSIVLPTIHEVDLFRWDPEVANVFTLLAFITTCCTVLVLLWHKKTFLCLILRILCPSRCFHPVFFHIQMLWELVLLGEALVVMAPSPAESSDTVLALVRWVGGKEG